MALYSPDSYEYIYTKYTLQQCKRGGENRAKNARRHPVYKFFMSALDTVSIPDNYVHGRAGGLARAKKLREQKEK